VPGGVFVSRVGGDDISSSATAEGGGRDGECRVGDIVVRVQGKGGGGGAERGVGDTIAIICRTTIVCYIFHHGYTTAMVASVLFIAVGSTAVLELRL